MSQKEQPSTDIFLAHSHIVIGVTGHRKLDNEKALSVKIQEVLSRIFEVHSGNGNTKLNLCVLSPLAEGADRLVTKAVFERDEEAMLKVVLPLTLSDYLEDFGTTASKEEFNKWMAKAGETLCLKDKPLAESYPSETLSDARREAYEDVGKYVVDHCDALIALWDGEPARGRGGTADIIAYAQEKKHPVYVIRTNESERT